MSEEKTKDIEEKYTTQPTIITVLERIASLEDGLNAKFDRIMGVVRQTQAELHSLRADFLDLRREPREHFPAVK